MSILKYIRQLFCKHVPYQFRALNDPDVLVCKKCHKSYSAKAGKGGES